MTETDWKLINIAEMIIGLKYISAVRYAIDECRLDWEEYLILAVDLLVEKGYAREPIEYFVNQAKGTVLQ